MKYWTRAPGQAPDAIPADAYPGQAADIVPTAIMAVAVEACSGAHFWGRDIGKLGHDVQLIPPAYVKPFVEP